MDELTLADDIALVHPADLSLPDCMHRLVTLDGSPRPLRRTKTEARRDPLLDESMILLNGSYHIWVATTHLYERPNRERVHLLEGTRQSVDSATLKPRG
jgi:hypothetical protein